MSELKGVEYAHSAEKRRFDRYAVRLARPFAVAAQFAMAMGSDTNPVFLQTRIGKDGDQFETFKLRTLGEDCVTPINNTAALMRRTGLDELIQYKNIVNGDMSMVARRPLTPQEYDQAFDDVPRDVVDEYMRLVVPTRPGLVSSFVIATHTGQIDDHAMRLKRLELDIKDVKDGSYENDKKLFWSVVSKGFTNKMKKGDIRPTKAQ